LQLSDISTSSVRFVPGPGPAQEVIVQQPLLAAQEVVLIEDIDENDDEFVLPPQIHVMFDMNMDGYHPLAIVPYIANPFLNLLAEEHIDHINNHANIAVKEKVIKKRLTFEDESQEPMQIVSNENISASLPYAKKKGKVSKETPESEASVRRSTRQSVKKDGFKLEPMRDKVTPPRKKPKSTKPRIPKPSDRANVSPHTPISTLRAVGNKLEIPEAEMIVEKLMAAPVEGKGKNFINE
jgi:hypothetical protein